MTNVKIVIGGNFGDEGKGLALMDARLFISIAEEYRNGR